jgi:hypothetical protein
LKSFEIDARSYRAIGPVSLLSQNIWVRVEWLGFIVFWHSWLRSFVNSGCIIQIKKVEEISSPKKR